MTPLLICIIYCSLLNFALPQNTNNNNYEDTWLSFPACKLGRLQSPIKLSITDSVFNSDFSIVYEHYTQCTLEDSDKNSVPVKSKKVNDECGGYMNFEKKGVIKQYKLKRFDLFNKMHSIEGKHSEMELHIIYEKVLGFTTNKNQYQRIQDTNNYLGIVLRYNTTEVDESSQLISDNGLLDKLLSEGSENNTIDLSAYPVYQDKKAFFYDGSFPYNPCQEDITYYIVEPVFKATSKPYGADTTTATKTENFAYDRPIYRNYMNYIESLKGGFIDVRKSMYVIIMSIFVLMF